MLCYKAFIMPETGLEPVQDIIPGDFKSPVSTKFHHSGGIYITHIVREHHRLVNAAADLESVFLPLYFSI
jgi:hypothetical protein